VHFPCCTAMKQWWSCSNTYGLKIVCGLEGWYGIAEEKRGRQDEKQSSTYLHLHACTRAHRAKPSPTTWLSCEEGTMEGCG
jgi:hypothetical protein